jgi:diguanylate cyclase (GGDEF)-like protein
LAAAGLVAALYQGVLLIWPAGALTVSNAGLIAATATAALMTGLRAHRDPGPGRWAWRLASLATALWCLSRLLYLPAEVLDGHPLRHPALADIPATLALAATVAAAVAMPGAPLSGASRLRALLDGVMITSALFGLAWMLVLAGGYEDGHGDRYGVLALIYPGTAVVVMSVVLVMGVRRPRGDGLALLCAGMVPVAAAITLNVVADVRQVPLGPAGLDGGLLLGALMFALASRLPVRDLDGPDWADASVTARALPYLPVVLQLLAIGSLRLTGRPVTTLAEWSGVLTVGCLIARQFITAEMNAALARQLRHQRGELAHQAVHDSLTGAGNRVLLDQRVRARLADRDRVRGDALLLVDLDGFKTVNDTYGHAAGDAVLVAVTGRLRTAAGESGTVTRLGGDEFVVLLEEVTEEGAAAAAEDILERLRGPVGVTGLTLRVRASVGVALLPVGATTDAEELLHHADLALYEAKTAGKDCARVFADGTQAAVAERMRLDAELRDALDRGEFALFYQPIMTLDGSAEVTGVEALLRWRHPYRGLLAPPQFLTRAETLTLMPALTRWTLREACWQAARWGTEVNVNVSASQVLDPALEEHVRDALMASGLPPARLTLEITEHAILADLSAAAVRLTAVKRLGVRLALDDFGTGYSSLTHLNRLSIDVIKIDKSFIDNITDPATPAVAEALLRVAGTLGLVPVAEGVEHREQAERLTALGCPHAQGYYFARPMEAGGVTDLLAQQRAALPAQSKPRTALPA